MGPYFSSPSALLDLVALPLLQLSLSLTFSLNAEKKKNLRLLRLRDVRDRKGRKKEEEKSLPLRLAFQHKKRTKRMEEEEEEEKYCINLHSLTLIENMRFEQQLHFILSLSLSSFNKKTASFLLQLSSSSSFFASFRSNQTRSQAKIQPWIIALDCLLLAPSSAVSLPFSSFSFSSLSSLSPLCS